MFNLGLFEMTLFGVIALVVLGPDKLLVAARTLGRWYATFMRTKERLQHDVISELSLLQTQQELQQELAKLRAFETQMQQQMHQLQGQIQKNSQALWQASDPEPTPMQGRFFLLSDNERRRRLPNPPFLPNYRADDLLYQTT